MDNSDIFGAKHHVDGIFLSSIQVGEVHGREDKGLWLLVTIEQVTQIAQASFALDGTVQRFHHQTVAGLVERELDAQLLGILQIDNGETVGNGHHHAVAIDIADGARMAEVFDDGRIVIHTKERYRLSELEVVLDVGIGRTHQFNSQLVQRVIVALADLHGPPGIAALDLPRNTRLLGLLAEGLFLCLVL